MSKENLKIVLSDTEFKKYSIIYQKEIKETTKCEESDCTTVQIFAELFIVIDPTISRLSTFLLPNETSRISKITK